MDKYTEPTKETKYTDDQSYAHTPPWRSDQELPKRSSSAPPAPPVPPSAAKGTAPSAVKGTAEVAPKKLSTKESLEEISAGIRHIGTLVPTPNITDTQLYGKSLYEYAARLDEIVKGM